MDLRTGLTGKADRTVTEDLTAQRLGSGDVPVLGTPALLALIEQAAVAAVAGALQPGKTSVGVWVDLEHLAPSRVGAEIRAEAELVSVDGRRLEFECRAFEGDVAIGLARHRRVIVDRERFDGG